MPGGLTAVGRLDRTLGTLTESLDYIHPCGARYICDRGIYLSESSFDIPRVGDKLAYLKLCSRYTLHIIHYTMDTMCLGRIPVQLVYRTDSININSSKSYQVYIYTSAVVLPKSPRTRTGLHVSLRKCKERFDINMSH